MWYGKLAVIMIIFSIASLISDYMIGETFNNSVLLSMGGFQYLAPLEKNSLTVTSISANPSLLFGDFISVFTWLGNFMTGGIFSQNMAVVQQEVGPAAIYVQIIMGILFDSSVCFFLLYILSFRSI